MSAFSALDSGSTALVRFEDWYDGPTLVEAIGE